MKLCDLNYADFIIWRESELVVIRIERDFVFLEEALHKAEEFFKYGVLPELLARWYTTHSTASNTDVTGDADSIVVGSSPEKQYCYCKEEKDSLLICCDGQNCSIEWFHVECLKLKRVPKGKWFCPDCRKIKKLSSTKRKTIQ